MDQVRKFVCVGGRMYYIVDILHGKYVQEPHWVCGSPHFFRPRDLETRFSHRRFFRTCNHIYKECSNVNRLFH